MKAKKALGMALALASALFFVACSNMDSGSVDNGDAARYSANRTLGVKINNFELSDGSGTAVYDPWINRTVLPEDTYSPEAGDQLVFVLRAISDGKKEKFKYLEGGAWVDDSDHTKGYTYSVTLDAASYDFWVYAYPKASKGALEADALFAASDVGGGNTVTTALWAHGAQDLTNGDGSLDFTLSPVDLTGEGNVKLAGAYVDPDGSVKGVKIGLYNIYTNALVGSVVSYTIDSPSPSTETAPTYFGNAAGVTGTCTTGVIAVDEGDAASFDVPAGSYRAAVQFFQDTAMKTEIGYWSDFVVVEPTNKSENLGIFFKGIKTLPASPTGLTASLVKGTYGAGKETYDVVLDWTDKAENEKGFLVRVRTYDIDFATPKETQKTEKIYGFIGGTIEGNTVEALIDSGYFTQTATDKTNLLLSQCASITLTLQTGYLYDFEVCAYNAIGCSKYKAADATADGFQTTDSTAAKYYDLATRTWAPRKISAGTKVFAAGKMEYIADDPAAAVAPGWTDVDTSAGDVTAVKGTNYYDSAKKIAYVTKMPKDSEYYTLTANTGTPYTTYRVNLFYVRYDLEGGLYYGSSITSGSQYAFFRFGNETPTINKDFGAPTGEALNGTDALQNPITADDVKPDTAGSTATKPFILSWNSSASAYYNWRKWIRQSSTANGVTKDYTAISGAPIPADPLLLTENNAAYGNQVVYAEYVGAESEFAITLKINSAADGAYDLQDGFITAEAVATKSATSGDALTKTQDAVNEVDITPTSGKPFLYLKVASTETWQYSAVRYEINGVKQSSTVNSATGACVIPLADWEDKGPITVLVAGYYDGNWYSRSFFVSMKRTD